MVNTSEGRPPLHLTQIKLFNAIATDAVIGASLIAVEPVRATQCYEHSILSPTPFMGNHGEVFEISNGSWWQVSYSYEYMYEYYPKALMCDNGNVYVKGKKINFRLLNSFVGGKPDA